MKKLLKCWRLTATLCVLPSLIPLCAQELWKPGAKPEKLHGGFEFTEGPAADAQGNIYFSDIPNSRIYRWSLDGALTTFRENSGRANGLFFDARGDLLACEGGNRRVTSIDPDGEVAVLADQFEDKPLNSPNDLWVDPRGGVYFTDPRYGSLDGMEQDGFHVYYIAPDRKSIHRVIKDLVKPNGIIGVNDGKTLYVADAGDNKTYRYEILGPGRLGDRKLLIERGSDGMTLDAQGNIYLTQGSVYVYDAAGRSLGKIDVDEAPANVCFGGADFRTLFITARTSLYAMPMNVAGQRPWPVVRD